MTPTKTHPANKALDQDPGFIRVPGLDDAAPHQKTAAMAMS